LVVTSAHGNRNIIKEYRSKPRSKDSDDFLVDLVEKNRSSIAYFCIKPKNATVPQNLSVSQELFESRTVSRDLSVSQGLSESINVSQELPIEPGATTSQYLSIAPMNLQE